MLVTLPKQRLSSKQSLSFDALGVEALERSNNDQRFSHLLSIMPAGVLVIDQFGLVSLANQQAINLLGEPLMGKAWRDVIARVFTPKADDGHEVSMRNGKRVKIDISPLTQEKGQLIVITDLTETRQLQSRVGHMQRLSSLGKMVASLAHQVRTPLSSALLYAENLKSMPLKNEIASRFSEKLTTRLKELESQVNDMLLFAKSSDKQIVAQVSVDEIVNQSVSQVEAQLQQANIHLTCDNQISEESILGNTTAIVGGITNLITNAMQALSESTQEYPHVCFNIKQISKDGQSYAAFTIKDNGKGLSKTNVSSLFEPFYTTKSQGTGLGLAVVNTVAKSHKGFVKCGNNEAGGAFFSLYLPISSAAETISLHNDNVDADESDIDNTDKQHNPFSTKSA
jgi:two-component system sensor histidine kinase FlrB